MEKVQRVLLVNDDGIDAPGFDVLKNISKKISNEVWIFAPKADNSGAGRSLTLRKDINVVKRSDRTYEVNGTPTDCIILALNHFMRNAMPDLVLSGVNAGRNAADDVTYSGTVGAAWEASVLGVPGIALSQMYNKELGMNFSAAECYGEKIINLLINLGLSSDTVINVNFPPFNANEVKGYKFVELDSHKLKDDIHYETKKGNYRIGPMITKDHLKKNSDLYVLKKGFISITPLLLNITNIEILKKLKAKNK